ncbi:MAG: hypothetical protein FWH35_06505 [Treponema sp.]|nr:hypothetical protein [Treponema sp.]
MKKFIFVLIMFALAAGVYAVEFSLDFHLSTSPYVPAFEGHGAALPSIGFGVGLDPIDLLFNMEFMHIRQKESDSGSSMTGSDTLFGMYFGVAPKIKPMGNWTISFPGFFKILLIGNREKYSDTPPDGTYKNSIRGGFGFDIGSRAYYALSQRWSIYAGFQAEVFAFYGKGKAKFYGGDSSDGNVTNTYWFDTGSIDLGVKFTF